jgi:peptidoglycan/LPS O-acetylase OafA/YrhL
VSPPSDTRRRGHDNNFGFLRLLFATLVIVSHSAEIIDGNRSREALMLLIGGNMTFGEIAVDAFFIISGYLVLKSFEYSETSTAYLLKRIRRIYPGFLAAVVFGVFIAQLAGVDLTALTFKEWCRIAANVLLLNAPNFPTFMGLPATVLNGSIWSIPIEFRCYLLIIILAAIKFYKKPWLLLILVGALMRVNQLKLVVPWPGPIGHLTGYPPLMIRMIPMFCVGSIYYLFQNRIPYHACLAFISASGLVISLHFSAAPEAAVAIFGSYLIFWFALGFRSKVISRINSRTDISYGVYLYAWPIQCSLALYFSIKSPLTLMATSTPIVFLIGLVSWRFFERPFIARTVDLAKLNVVSD